MFERGWLKCCRKYRWCLRLNPADDVVIARRKLVAGTLLKPKA